MRHLNPKTNQPYKVLWFGDLVALSGFGRIGNEVTRRLAARGYSVQGVGMQYSGWPHDFPFHIWPPNPANLFETIVQAVGTFQPDILVSCQDFPYHQQIWQGCRLDFSRMKWVFITPIDGTPVHPDWVKVVDVSDGALTISRFGVEALRQAGKRVGLCHPGAARNEFYPVDAPTRAGLREKAGLAPDAWVVGVVCMNQGRKAIAPMIEAFHEHAKDKPGARLYLDMDRASPAGWDLPALLIQMGWTETERARVVFKDDLFKRDFAAFAPLVNRYALMDAHMVISHREGFGLPLLESMACRVPTLALDWCSGTEIVGEGRGLLVRRLPYMQHGTWGGARDAFPDMADLVAKLNLLYDQPAQAAAIAETGYRWAIQQTWDAAADAVEDVIQSALKRERKEPPSHVRPDPNPAPSLNDTAGPADAVGRDPVLSQAGGPDPVPAGAGADGSAAGA